MQSFFGDISGALQALQTTGSQSAAEGVQLRLYVSGTELSGASNKIVL